MSNPQVKAIPGTLSPANDNEDGGKLSDGARYSAISNEDITHASTSSTTNTTTPTGRGPTLTPVSERSLTPTNATRKREPGNPTSAASRLSVPLTSGELDGTSIANIIDGPRIRRSTKKVIDPGLVETANLPSMIAKVKAEAETVAKKKKKVMHATLKSTTATAATFPKQPMLSMGASTASSLPSASARTMMPTNTITYTNALPLSSEPCRRPSFNMNIAKIAGCPVMRDDGVDDWADFVGDPSAYVNHRDLCDTIASIFIQRACRARSEGKTWQQFEASEMAVSDVSSNLDNGLKFAILKALAPALSTQIWDTPGQLKQTNKLAKPTKNNHKKRKLVTSGDEDEIAVRLSNPPPVSLHGRWARDNHGMLQPLYGGETAVPNGIELSMRKSGFHGLSGLKSDTNSASEKGSSKMESTLALTESAITFGGQTALEDVVLRPLDFETSDETGDWCG